MDGALIVRLWLYVGAADDSGVYSSFAELISLPRFNSDDAIIGIILFHLSFSACIFSVLCSPRIIEDTSCAEGLRSVRGDALFWSAQRIKVWRAQVNV